MNLKISIIALILAFFVQNVHAQGYEITQKDGKFGIKTKAFKLKAKYLFIYPCKYAPDYVVMEAKNYSHLLNTKSGQSYYIEDDIYEYLYEDSCVLTTENRVRLRGSEGMGLYQFPEQALTPTLFKNVYKIDMFPDFCLVSRKKNEYSIYNLNAKTQTEWFYLRNYWDFNLDNDICYLSPEERVVGKINDKCYISVCKETYK
jgi:hypothetical protein